MITSSDGDVASGTFDYNPILVLEPRSQTSAVPEDRRETIELLPKAKVAGMSR